MKPAYRLIRGVTSMRTAVLLAFASIGCAKQVPSQGPPFGVAPGSPVAVGAASGQVVLADANGDGHLDMVIWHPQGRTVTIQLGDGKGGFTPAPAKTIVFEYSPADIVLGDLNNDGILDFGVTSADRDVVDVFLGDGSGGVRLAPASPFTASPAVQRLNKRSLHLVDINNDGNLDFVTENGRRNDLGILFGDGRGGFSSGPTVLLDPDHDGYSSGLGDIDGDRHVDVVTVRTVAGSRAGEGRLVTRRGDGTGAFQNPSGSHMPVPPDSRLLALVDLNGDQRPDVVLSHGNHLSVLLNVGGAAFAPSLASPLDLRARAFTLAVADVNGDQKPDLLGATVSSVTVLIADGRGGFAPAPGSPFDAGPGVYHLALGDVNEDGKLDVVASSFDGTAVTVLLGRSGPAEARSDMENGTGEPWRTVFAHRA